MKNKNSPTSLQGNYGSLGDFSNMSHGTFRAERVQILKTLQDFPEFFWGNFSRLFFINVKDFAEAHDHFSVKAQLFQKNQMCSFVLACGADENNLEFVSFPSHTNQNAKSEKSDKMTSHLENATNMQHAFSAK